MKITLSQYAGFCEGVARAYDMVEEIANDPKVKRPIAVLGSLVHNNDVVRKIEKLGVCKLELENSIEETLKKAKGKIKTLVVTAHGMGPDIYELALENGFDLVDTTCPRVLKVQKLAKLFHEKKSQIVIIGEKNHKEVKGISEWAQGKAVILENETDLENISLNGEKNIVLLSQTTQDQEFVEHASEVIRKKYPKVEVFDSICLTTHHRQTEVKQLAKENDVMVVIGAPESANSNRLYEISERVNENTYFIESADQLKSDWFVSCDRVGISAGASTPSWIIDDVISQIRNFGKEESVLYGSLECELSL